MTGYSYCQKVGIELVTLETYEEQSDFLRFCAENSPYLNLGLYVGAMNTFLKTTENWHWIHSDQKASFPIRFASGQPNYSAGQEHCLIAYFANGKYSGKYDFHDYNGFGAALYSFACQEAIWY